jgi:myo-inositol-1-phosphate synthase
MSIKVAIVGVGNCASSLVQGIAHYSTTNDSRGLILPTVGQYSVGDIEIVAAFDITVEKVGRTLNEAIKGWPNDTFDLGVMLPYCGGPTVLRGPTMDGLGRYLRESLTESNEPPVNVTRMLKDSGAQVVVCYLPVGSDEAARYYAGCAIEAGCALVNCIPAFLASDPTWAERFKAAGLPIIGDDVKSQVGATIVHRVLVQLMRDRGVHLLRTHQLNVGGNADFLNMLERDRLVSKKISKTRAVTSVMGVELPANDVHIGPSDHVGWLSDRKWAYIRLEGENFGGAPVNIELKLEVWDSPNSAAVVVDAIRCAKVALDRKEAGALIAPSSWLMKSPPQQFDDDVARRKLEVWLG